MTPIEDTTRVQQQQQQEEDQFYRNDQSFERPENDEEDAVFRREDEEIENKLNMIQKEINELKVEHKPTPIGIVIGPNHPAKDDPRVEKVVQKVNRITEKLESQIDQRSSDPSAPIEPRPTSKKPQNPYKRDHKRWKAREDSKAKKEELKTLIRLYEQKQRMKQNKPRAALIIQKWVRGYLQRREFARMKLGIKKIRKLRRFLSVGYKKIKVKVIKNLILAIRQSSKVIRKERKTVMSKYINYCATVIQKVYRGYVVRRYVVPEMLDDIEAQHRAVALLKGWQIRKIVSCGEVAGIIRKIQEITNYQRQLSMDPNAIGMLPILAHNRKCEVLNFLITIHRLSQTGDWIKSKKINPASAYYQRYVLPQQQYPFLPYFNPTLFLNQSLQFASQPLEQTQSLQQRASLQTGEVPYFRNLEMQSPPRDIQISPIRPEGSPEGLVERQSPPKHYDTANEQQPLPKPKADFQTKIEFDNDNFNEKSKFKNNKFRLVFYMN